MERRKGYYWVKPFEHSEWESANWTGCYWYLTGDECNFIDLQLHKINEARIPAPDEVITATLLMSKNQAGLKF